MPGSFRLYLYNKNYAGPIINSECTLTTTISGGGKYIADFPLSNYSNISGSSSFICIYGTKDDNVNTHNIFNSSNYSDSILLDDNVIFNELLDDKSNYPTILGS